MGFHTSRAFFFLGRRRWTLSGYSSGQITDEHRAHQISENDDFPTVTKDFRGCQTFIHCFPLAVYLLGHSLKINDTSESRKIKKYRVCTRNACAIVSFCLVAHRHVKFVRITYITRVIFAVSILIFTRIITYAGISIVRTRLI